MIEKRSAGERVYDALVYLFMLVLLVVMIYPFLYIVNYSISSAGQISQPLLLWPQGVNFESYKLLFSDDSVFRAFFISVSRSVLGSAIMLLVTGTGAYAISRPNLIFGKFFRMFFLFTMYFSAGVIPTYILYKNLGLTNSFWVYIWPMAVVPFNMILIKTYIESLPRELEEAVLIDGGTEVDSYFRVILQMCLPVNAAVLMFSCINHWNSFIDTQLYNAMRPDLHTLQYVLYNTLAVQMQRSLEDAKNMVAGVVSSQSLKMAITVVTVVPIMCVYPFLRKYFVSGLLVGSVKA
ncbi:MAG: carbohydrate ABC transporter permease [Oscillospiraceae bacterium]